MINKNHANSFKGHFFSLGQFPRVFIIKILEKWSSLTQLLGSEECASGQALLGLFLWWCWRDKVSDVVWLWTRQPARFSSCSCPANDTWMQFRWHRLRLLEIMFHCTVCVLNKFQCAFEWFPHISSLELAAYFYRTDSLIHFQSGGLQRLIELK